MSTETTFAIIKPDAVEKNLAGAILAHIEKAGFVVRGAKRVHLSKKQAEGFYAEHRERGFFGELTTFMSRGPVYVLALEAPGAIAKWRETMGATDPAQAALRGQQGRERHARLRLPRGRGARDLVLLRSLRADLRATSGTRWSCPRRACRRWP